MTEINRLEAEIKQLRSLLRQCLKHEFMDRCVAIQGELRADILQLFPDEFGDQLKAWREMYPVEGQTDGQ